MYCFSVFVELETKRKKYYLGMIFFIIMSQSGKKAEKCTKFLLDMDIRFRRHHLHLAHSNCPKHGEIMLIINNWVCLSRNGWVCCLAISDHCYFMLIMQIRVMVFCILPFIHSLLGFYDILMQGKIIFIFHKPLD